MIVISDNSALSCLAELGELDLLRQLYGTVTITTTVLAEALHGGAPVALQQLAANPPPWVAVLPDMRPYLPETIRIEDGEASSITLAWQHRFRSLLIMDEKKGRRVAAALGLNYTGAAGVLTDAAIAGLVEFDEVFQRLAQTKFRLAHSIIEDLRQRLKQAQP